jgi:hypothetical protein
LDSEAGNDDPAAATRRILNSIFLTEIAMKQLESTKEQVVRLSVDEMHHVSGGVEKEGVRPRKFGDVDYQVYVDGVLMGTTYGPAAPVDPDVGSGRPIDPITNGR